MKMTIRKMNVKKMAAVAAIAAVVVGTLTACGGPGVELLDEPVIEYGESVYFTQEDMDAGIAVIEDTMAGWSTQCNIQAISYAGDEMSLKGLYYCGSMVDEDVNYEACMVFLVDFVTPSDAKGFEKNKLYEDWEWYIVKDEDGTWKFFNNGQNLSEMIDIPDDFDLTTLMETKAE